MPVTIPRDQSFARASRGDGKDRWGRKPMTSLARGRRAGGSRTRCLPGSRRRTSITPLKSLVVATVLSVPPLVLPVTPADAACETNERLDHWGANHLTAGPCATQVALGGLHIDPWRSREAGELAGIAGLAGGRWGERSSDRFAQPAGDDSAWTRSRGTTGRGLVLVSSFRSTAGDSAALGGRWWALDWRPAAPMRIAVDAVDRGSRGDALVGPFGAECERSPLPAPAPPSYGIGGGGSSAGFRYELGDSLSGVHPPARVALTERLPAWGVLGYPTDVPAPTECDGDGDGSEGPLRPWRMATGMSPLTPDLNGGAGTRTEPGAALAFGPGRPRDLGEASLALLHADPDNRIEWNGHRRVALSGLCFESEGRGRC